MNFHKLEEAIGRLAAFGGISEGSAKLQLHALRQSQKFHVGSIDRLPNGEFSAGDFQNLPYKFAAFEFDVGPDDVGRTGSLIAICEQDGDRLGISVWKSFRVRGELGWVITGTVEIDRSVPVARVYQDRALSRHFSPEELRDYADLTKDVVSFVGLALRIINYTARSGASVAIETVSPPTALNKKRTLRKKLPIYEYRVLVLRRSGARLFAGGTHASPRVHLRRGHWKTIRGVDHWWQEHPVGKKELGIVAKDNSAGPLLCN